jgi:rod shape-determining protein MreD
MGIAFFCILLAALFLEGSITTLPLVLLVLLVMTVIYRQSFVFSVAFLAGLLLDLLTMRAVGQTSVVFVLFVLFIRLYERKFEVETLPFVLFASGIGTFIYGLIFGISDLLLETIASMIGGVLLFLAVELLRKKQQQKHRRYV